MRDRSPTDHRRSRAATDGEAGFTLVELLATMAVATIVLLAVLQGADALSRSTAASGRLTDAQETSRAVLRRMTDEARQAVPAPGQVTPLESVGRSSIVFATTTDVPGGTQSTWVRYCATSDGRLLRGQRQTAPAASQSASTCGDATAGWTYGVLVGGTLADGSRLFSFTAPAGYTAGNCPQQPITASVPDPPPCLPATTAVTGVGVRLAVADRATRASATVVTRGALSFRNRSQQ